MIFATKKHTLSVDGKVMISQEVNYADLELRLAAAFTEQQRQAYIAGIRGKTSVNLEPDWFKTMRSMIEDAMNGKGPKKLVVSSYPSLETAATLRRPVYSNEIVRPLNRLTSALRKAWPGGPKGTTFTTVQDYIDYS